MSQARFADLDFGFTSAERESATKPALLTDGFFDVGGAREKVLNGPYFLCLGYKGSGKSAIAEHVRLTADSRSDLFVRRLYLSDFPFSDFGNVLRGSQDVKARYPATWSWLLYLQLLASLAEDAGAGSLDRQSFDRTIELLRRYGFLPTPSLHEVVLKSAERSFRLSLGKTVEGGVRGTRASTADINFLTLVETLRRVVGSVRSESRHLLLIDGLDDVLLRDPVQFDTLAALIVEVSRLNAALADSGAPAKVVLLCRSDIYDLLPGPNLNKVRQDSALELNWYTDPTYPERSDLISLANAKARVTDPLLSDVFAAYFPPTVNQNGTQTPIRRYLLERTRALPRDFLQLLKAIQEVSDRARRHLDSQAVIGGFSRYARGYFFSEVRDELAGHFEPQARDIGLQALAHVRARFSLRQFEGAVAQVGGNGSLDSERFLRVLYDCGAVGNMQTPPGGRVFLSFRYRNPNVPFNATGSLRLHRALAHALNIPASDARS